MEIIQARPEHLQEILEIYVYAREFMKSTGNPNQWKDDRPPIEAIEADLENKRNFLLVNDGIICGVFALVIGEDPTYAVIENGTWLNNEPYGTIHRIAGNGRCKGIVKAALEFAASKTDNIRIDTHEDNAVMRHLLEKNGFEKCGIIYVDDGTPRVAYQKVVR